MYIYIYVYIYVRIYIYIYTYIVILKKIEKLQPEERQEWFSGLQVLVSLVSRWYLLDFLHFDDFECTVPCK